jgi:hypothetical protein
MLARRLFPGGVEVDCSGGLGEAIRSTRELVWGRLDSGERERIRKALLATVLWIRLAMVKLLETSGCKHASKN